MKYSLSIFIFCCFTSFASSQIANDSLKTAYVTKTILLNNGVRINNQLVTKTNTELLMKQYESSNKYYHEYLKARKPAMIYPVLSLVAIIGGFFIARENNTVGIVVISSSTIFTLLGAKYIRRANNNMNLAVWHYNKEVLFGNK